MQTSPKQLGPAREEAAAPWSSCRALLGNPPLGSAKLPRQERRRGASRGAPQPYHCCEWAARSESWPPATGLRHQARGTVSRPKTGTKPPRVKSRAPDPVVIFQTSRGGALRELCTMTTAGVEAATRPGERPRAGAENLVHRALLEVGGGQHRDNLGISQRGREIRVRRGPDST